MLLFSLYVYIVVCVSKEKSESSSGKNSSGYRRDWGATRRKSGQGFIRRLRRFREVPIQNLWRLHEHCEGPLPRNLESVPSLPPYRESARTLLAGLKLCTLIWRVEISSQPNLSVAGPLLNKYLRYLRPAKSVIQWRRSLGKQHVKGNGNDRGKFL